MKNLIYILLLFMVCGATSCFDDDSSLGTIEIGDIEISGLKDTSIVSYNGNILQLSPEVKAGYPEEEMKYAWYLVKGNEKQGYRTHCIGEDKDLSYEINLPSGVYTVVFESSSTSNSYTKTATFILTVSTPFSQGFYILKETADGNTELDLLTQDGLIENMMTSLTEAPLNGKPISMSVVYGNGYIDDETLEMSSANMVHVFTEQDYRAFRTEDMKQTFSRENVMFEPMQDNETFYTIIQPYNITCLTSKGVYSGSSGESSGKLGVPEVEGGGSKFIQSFSAGQGGDIYWNNQTHSLYNATAGEEMEYNLPAGFEAASLECIASGLNYMNGTDEGWFLCQSGNGQRLLFNVTSEMVMWGMYETKVEAHAVDGTKHLAKGNVIAGNALDAKIIYVADNGQLYTYTLDTQEETNFTLQGLEGEIIYICNNYLNLNDWFGSPDPGNFNYLVVATRNGAGYHLYLYDNLVGGIPKGAAVRKVSGESGKVKAVRYLSTTLTPNDLTNNVFSYSGPVFPYGD